MKKLFYLLFLSASISSCVKEKEPFFNQGKVTINGHIDNYSAKDSIFKISFYSKNIFELEQYQTSESQIDSLGNFQVTFEIPHKQFIFFYYGNKNGQLYVDPNENLKLTFDSKEVSNYDGFKRKNKNFISSARVEGSLSEINKLYTAYYLNDPTDFRKYYESLASRTSSEEAYKLIDSTFKVRNEYIDSFISENKLPEEFVTFLTTEKEIKPVVDLMQYLVFHYRPKSKDKTIEDDFSMEYLNRISNLPILTEKNLVNEEVFTSLPNYYGPYLSKLLMSKYNTKKYKVLDSIKYQKELLTSKENPFFTQLMYFDRLKVSLNNNDLSFYNKNKQVVDSVLKNTVFEEHVARHYKTVKDLINKPKLPKNTELLSISSTNGKEILDEIIKNANGKVIFIDNWATWCGPCKTQFKEATPKLKKEFKEDVEFVYFCHESKKKLYEPTIAQYQVEGKHYFMNKEQTISLAKELNIEGYPTYNIIDQKGKILHSGFEFRPSLENTSKILRDLVGKK